MTQKLNLNKVTTQSWSYSGYTRFFVLYLFELHSDPVFSGLGLDGISRPVFLLLGITLEMTKGRVIARIQYVNSLYSVI